MSAKPGAYDDLASVYAAETSVRRLHGWHPLAADRANNGRPSLAQVEAHSDTDPQSALIDNTTVPETAKELGVRRFFDDATVRQAAQRGGAANKARWDAIKAARKLPEAA